VPTYGYTGREPDATGLIHYRARYYSPEIGRFVSRDPLGLSAGINPYAYADGNPVLFNDPDGLMAALAWNSASSYVKGTVASVNTKLGETDPYAPPVSYQDFARNIEGKSLGQVQNEAGVPGFSLGSYKSGFAGPAEKYRYVRDTGNPAAVVDMRHFLVVGERGNLYGLGVEILQQINGFSDSAFKLQDFYSNRLVRNP
jgi:RHS repeat-associated protein